MTIVVSIASWTLLVYWLFCFCFYFVLGVFLFVCLGVFCLFVCLVGWFFFFGFFLLCMPVAHGKSSLSEEESEFSFSTVYFVIL